jgi:DNA-damage-inducible protein J
MLALFALSPPPKSSHPWASGVDSKPTIARSEAGSFPAFGLQCGSEEIYTVPDNSVVRARIDDRTKREAAAALKKIGLTVSDAFRLLLVRVAAEKALPFEPLNPSAETIAAMKAARRGELVKAGKPDKLLRSLNAGR